MNFLEHFNNVANNESIMSGLVPTFIKRYISPTIEEKTTTRKVTISGIPATDVLSAFSKKFGMYGSEVIWTSKGVRSLVIDSWFVPDLIFMIDTVYKTSKYKKTLWEIREGLVNDTWYKDSLNTDRTVLNYDNLSRLKWSPLKHQKEYLEYYDNSISRFGFKGGVTAMAPGLGKTFTALALAETLDVDLIIIATLKNTISDPWENSIRDIYKKKQRYWSVRSKGLPTKHDRFVIINYEQIANIKDHLVNLHGVQKKKCLVILDECHNLNNMKAKRTLDYIDLTTDLATNVVGLSGTPIKAVGSEIVPLLKAVDTMFTKSAEEKFTIGVRKLSKSGINALTNRIRMYVKIVDKSVSKLEPYNVETVDVQFEGSEEFTLPVISKKMQAYAKEALERYLPLRDSALSTYWGYVKRTSKHPSYPKFKSYVTEIIRSRSYRHLTHEMGFVNQYEKDVVFKELNDHDRKDFKGIRALAKYPALKVLGETLGVILTQERIRCNIEIAKNIDYKAILETTHKKTLIFSNNIKVVSAAVDSMTDLSPMAIWGNMSKKIPEMVKEYSENKDINPLVTTYSSLSTGVPITAAANVVILDSPFRYNVLEQAISRAHRLGNDAQVTVFYINLVTPGEVNINGRSMDLAKWSSNEVSSILGIDAPIEFPDENIKEITGTNTDQASLEEDKPIWYKFK